MKTLLTVLLVLLNTDRSFSQDRKIEQNQLITRGTASLTFPADRVQFAFGVKGVGPSIEQAVKQATGRAAQIIAQLRSIGIADTQIQTSRFNSADNPEGKSWWSSKEDFAAGVEVNVTLDSPFEHLERAVQAAAAGNVEYISHLRFSLRNNAQKQLAAYRAAAEDARAKAEMLVSTLGASIVRVLHIEDQTDYPVRPPALQAGVAVRGGRSPEFLLPAQQFSVEARVHVVFEIGKKQ